MVNGDATVVKDDAAAVNSGIPDSDWQDENESMTQQLHVLPFSRCVDLEGSVPHTGKQRGNEEWHHYNI